MAATLVLRLMGLGDIVHLIPSLQLLREHRKNAKIGLVCHEPFGQIIPKDLKIKIHSLRPGHNYLEFLKLLKEIRREKYDEAFDLFGNPTTAYLCLLGGIKKTYGFDYRLRNLAYTKTIAADKSNRRLTDLFADFFNYFGIPGSKKPLKLKPDANSVKYIQGAFSHLKKPIMVINPHSTYQAKSWNCEYFVEFIDLWYDKFKQPPIITWSEKDYEYSAKIQKMAGQNKVILAPKLNIKQLIALLAKADYFLTCDTGPMNISAAVQTPTIALFGPTTRAPVEPQGDQHLVLYDSTLECLQCHKEYCWHKSCMNNMKPLWVFDRIMHKYFTETKA